MRIILSITAAALLGCAQGGDKPAARDDLRSRVFEARNEVTVQVPPGAKRLRAWIALPQEDDAQDIKDLKVEAPVPHRIEKDSEGNRIAYLEAENPAPGELALVETFTITRREVQQSVDPKKASPITPADRARFQRYLQPNQHIVVDDRVRMLADEIAGGETNPVIAARKLYDWVLANVDYWVKDPRNKKASPQGSSIYCLDTRTGNCTDFHSLWTALARAKGIPTRLIYGSFFKKELDGQDVDASYHCWPEFYAPGIGWIPHDVAVADIFAGTFPVDAGNETLVRRTTAEGYTGPDPKMVEYYFGNLDERRVVWSTGRDLKLNPPQDVGPVNALPKAYIEVDGQLLAEGTGWKRKLTYREKEGAAAESK